MGSALTAFQLVAVGFGCRFTVFVGACCDIWDDVSRCMEGHMMICDLLSVQLDASFSETGSIPGVSFEQMKLQIKLGVPQPLQQSLDLEKVKAVFPYGRILNIEVSDGGLICSSGVLVEDMGDKNDDCYIVNAAVYVGY